ncbi:TRAP transporter large permease [Sediminivirga luteola]|uniref:C4-dicarboxylate ABC transporter n=1 Tax=Sediminivirga luteola TaxID=1774748 RepID=A0A8J2TY32_9MICO|nr:TRAP transporter large permease [Sediminivirga luteola]MCI2266496.1 TRAP transporter large permease [Sediminivirga luteola]GGA15163.1 C4-dicarboxylate ABC transporter [Sediminivirga luteola]
MSSLTQGAIILVIAMVLFLSGMPIAFALAITAIISVLLFLGTAQFDLFGMMVFDSLNDFGLLAIPLFVLMGNLFGGSTASRQLFEAGEAWLSRVKGGLAMSSVLASSVFAALTGSSPATAAAIGRVAVPEMAQRGYSSRIATGAIAAGGTLGILIPPSVTLILYGIAAEQSIGQLFAGGIVPGIVITVMFCVWIFIASRLEERRSRRPDALPLHGVKEYVAKHYTWPERFVSLAKVLPFGLLVFAVLFVLYRGIATPSEAAAVGVVLVMALIGIGYRGLRGRDLIKVLLETTNQSTMILMITAFSAVIAVVLSFLRVPQDLAALVTEMEVNRWVVMIVINVVLLVMGLFLPPVSIVVMVTPVLLPMIIALGFDPIWFGVIVTINMEMGLITPPVGLNLFVLKGIAPHVPLKEILIGATPYVGVLAVAILLFSVFPQGITWLPQLLYGGG